MLTVRRPLPVPAASFVALLFLLAACAPSREAVVVVERPPAQTPPPPPPTVAPPPAADLATLPAPGRFDRGKMWTFDNLPLAYFEEAYDLRPDTAWIERAQQAALRFSTNCSASFVSPHGLILTNHHCAREHIVEATRPGENLFEDGFYATGLEDERAVEDLFADQLLEIEDVTRRIEAATRGQVQDESRARRLADRIEAVEAAMTTRAKERDTTLFVEVVSLYDGARHHAYTYRRYHDVRLVMAPEQIIGHYGGSDDNFTYPRYTLDMALFRAYTPTGEPVPTEHYFRWDRDGLRPGDVVFAVGNPASTDRFRTLSQLDYARTLELPSQLAVFRDRAARIAAYLDRQPQDPGMSDLRTDYLSLLNTIKSYEGQLAGLGDSDLLARREAAEQRLRAHLAANDTLRAEYGDLFGAIEDLQRTKRATARFADAFIGFGSPVIGSRILLRAYYGFLHDFYEQRPWVPDDYVEENILPAALAVEDRPLALEKSLIAARLEELRTYLGPTDPTMRRLLGGRSPEEVAGEIVEGTALADSASYAALLEAGYLASDDPTVPLIEALAPLYDQFAEQVRNLDAREDNLNARLAALLLAVEGDALPSDASFSLRLSDGVVRGYDYNGTVAPPFTTFFGLYGHYHSYGPGSAWALPGRWLDPPPTFDRSTPLNLVSTNDITGGSSGSPLLDRELELVGLVFDGNIESLPNTFLYTDEAARTISVDARGILEALDDIYDADRLVLELLSGERAATEAEADAILDASTR